MITIKLDSYASNEPYELGEEEFDVICNKLSMKDRDEMYKYIRPIFAGKTNREIAYARSISTSNLYQKQVKLKSRLHWWTMDVENLVDYQKRQAMKELELLGAERGILLKKIEKVFKQAMEEVDQILKGGIG